MQGLDEIKARLEAFECGVPEMVFSRHVAVYYRRLIARVERLEKALEQINTIPIREYSVPHLSNIIHTIRPIAHNALAEEDGEP